MEEAEDVEVEKAHQRRHQRRKIQSKNPSPFAIAEHMALLMDHNAPAQTALIKQKGTNVKQHCSTE
eukprot:3190134-Ditylum_brightwellii.AAC.1